MEEGGGAGSGGAGEEEGECRDQDQETAAEVEVYCAVGKDAGKEWRANLRWVLANFPRSSHRLVLVHVHRPPRLINMMGAWVPVSQLEEHEVAAYRKLEEDRAGRALDHLLHICTSQRVHARKVVVAGDDAARGLVQLVEDHGVAELVMGAAADRAYTRKMRAPRSKKAVTVQRKANTNCRIWFICKGNLVCTREASDDQSKAEPSTASTSPRSSISDHSRSKASLHGDGDGEPSGSMHDTATATVSLRRTPSRDGSDSAEDSGHEEAAAEAGPSAAARRVQDVNEDPPTPSHDGSDNANEMDDALREKLRDAIMEARNLKQEAYEETRRRQKADRDLAEASRLARDAERSWQAEATRRKEAEERLARERAAMEQDRRELDAILEKIREVDGRSAELELEIAGSERAMGELGARMSESCSVLDALQLERRRGEPAASMPTVEVGVEVGGDQGLGFLRLGLSELEEATDGFDESARIGGGVYRGTLRGMSVAVKVVSPDIAVDEARFVRAADAMARARHPGLVAVVGACPEARAVVHELVPGGSLEDRLSGDASRLPWQTRCGVAYRTCATLAFLHSTGTVHGDVRPANILLEDERCSSSKLAGLGMRSLAAPKGVGEMALAYVDPRWLATGEEPTAQCDVHALGVVLLQLVTGMPAFAAKKAGREAADGNAAWHEVVDTSGGGWPMERATEVALLGLRCCDDDGAPAQIAGDGFTYEAAAMREWLGSGHDTSPMTNLKLPSDELVPNHALRAAIQEWRHTRPRSSSCGRFL